MADLLNQYGQVVTVDDTQVNQALQEGYTPAAPEDVAAAERKSEYSGLGHAALALGSGVASGATLGLSDAAISGLGGREALQAYEQNYGGLRTVGEVGGTLLGLGKFAGPGLAAKGLRAASMPARFAVGTGAAVERALGGKALGLVARGATEGALFGVGQGVSDLSLDDDPLTGEKIAAALSSNALTGAAYGGAFSAGLVGLGKAGSAIGRKLTGVGDDGVSAAVRAWDKASSAIGASEPGDIVKMFAKNKAGVRGYEIATMRDSHVAKAADDIFSLTEDLTKARNLAGENFRGRLKLEQVGKTIKTGNEAQARTATKAFVADMREQFMEMVANDVDFAKLKNTKDLLKKLDKLERKIDLDGAISSTTANRDAFMALDDFKRRIGDITDAASRSRNATVQMKNTFYKMEDAYMKTRSFLEDAGTWGDAAAMQKRINAPWAANISAERGFLGNIMKFEEVPGMWSKKLPRADREKIGKYVASIGDPNAAQTHEGMRKWLTSMEDFSDAALESMSLSAADRKVLESVGTKAKALRGHLDKAGEALTLGKTLADMGKRSDASAVLGGIVGGSLGGAPGAVIGTAASLVTNPANAIHRFATVGRLVGKVDAKLAGGIRGFMGNAAKRATVNAPRLTAPAFQFVEKHNRFTERDREVRHQVANADVIADQARTQTAALAGSHPAATETALERLRAKNDFLLRKLPQLDPADLHNPTLSKAEMDRFLRFDEAANDPLKIPELMAQGKLSPDHVEAVRAVWPGLFEQMQQEAMEGLTEMQAQGKEPAFQDAIQLGLMLDIPAHPMLRPKTIALLQSGYAKPQEPPAGPQPTGKPVNMAPTTMAMRTKTQELEEFDE